MPFGNQLRVRQQSSIDITGTRQPSDESGRRWSNWRWCAEFLNSTNIFQQCSLKILGLSLQRFVRPPDFYQL